MLLKEKKKHGFLEINSYAISQGLINFSVGAFGAYAFFFYETEVHLNITLLGILFIVYSIWDAINEPLIGNLTDRPLKITRKYGRRLPWVIIGVFPWALSYILIYLAPSDSQILIFFYALLILVIYDGFYTLWSVNSEALLPYKFSDFDERRKVSGMRGFWGVIGLILGFLVPPMIVDYGIKETYIFQAIILAIIICASGFLMIPGHKEGKEVLQRYLETYKDEKWRFNFFKDIVKAVKKKNFLMWLVLHFGYTILTGLLIASLNYFIKYILKLESSAMILGMSGYLLVSILSIPLWIKVAIKVNNNKKMIVLGSLFMGIATMVLFFANSIIAMLIIGCFVGLTGGVFFVMQDAINADVLDEMTLLDGERLEGTYLGVKFFFGRMANVVQFLILVLIHAFTNFVPEVINQSDLALLGIRLHISIIPGIAIIIGVLIFWKFYDLTPERMKEIKEKIIQQKL